MGSNPTVIASLHTRVPARVEVDIVYNKPLERHGSSGQGCILPTDLRKIKGMLLAQ